MKKDDKLTKALQKLQPVKNEQKKPDIRRQISISVWLVLVLSSLKLFLQWVEQYVIAESVYLQILYREKTYVIEIAALVLLGFIFYHLSKQRDWARIIYLIISFIPVAFNFGMIVFNIPMIVHDLIELKLFSSFQRMVQIAETLVIIKSYTVIFSSEAGRWFKNKLF